MSKKNKYGEGPVYLRITCDGHRAEVSVRIFVEPSKWQPARGRVRGNSPLVREGQRIMAGQPIAIARKNRIEFYVGNYLDKIYRNPDGYVDCICELPKAAPEY